MNEDTGQKRTRHVKGISATPASILLELHPEPGEGPRAWRGPASSGTVLSPLWRELGTFLGRRGSHAHFTDKDTEAQRN